mgnify:CR=1 FL=1
MFFLGLLVGTTVCAYYFYEFLTPDISHIDTYPFKQTSILYDRTGKFELYRLYGEENRLLVAHDDIPDTVRYATIVSEDASFYSHQGIDPKAIIRAFKANTERGSIEQGASTITQQLAKNLFLERDRTWSRKIREVFLAVKIDRNLSKDNILDLYLNAVPYGSNAYGIEAASQTFFKKSAKDLTLDESALIAALPNAPTLLSPYGANTTQLRARQRDILNKLLASNYITKNDFNQALTADTLKKITPPEHAILAPHFVFYAIEKLEEKYSKQDLQTKGYRIFTSLDYDLQLSAEKAVREGAQKNVARGAENAALVSLDAKTGEVLAMVGSKDYFDKTIDGNVNITTIARQPGSSFKPIAYAKAFEKGFQPETPIYDMPINFGPDGTGKDYIPNNYDGSFHGLLTMRQSLAMSLNIPAVQTLALAGVSETIELAKRMGITTLTDPKRYGLALVLGGAEVKPIEMASAFSVFSQEGIRHEINPVIRIIDTRGTDIYTATPGEGTRVMDAEVTRKISSILTDNKARSATFGSNTPLAFPESAPVAAKTGTTQNFRDAWTVGYSTSVATAVWVGNNDNKQMHEGSDGIFVAAPIFRQYMDAVQKRFPATAFNSYTQSDNKMGFASGGEDSQARVIYIDKKTGREISPEKAKKKKSDNVETRYVYGSASLNVSGGDNKGDTPPPATTLQQVFEFYQNYNKSPS